MCRMIPTFGGEEGNGVDKEVVAVNVSEKPIIVCVATICKNIASTVLPKCAACICPLGVLWPTLELGHYLLRASYVDQCGRGTTITSIVGGYWAWSRHVVAQRSPQGNL